MSTSTSTDQPQAVQPSARQKTVELYVEDQKRLVSSRADDEPAFLTDLRDTGISRFEQLGFPTTKDEDWRETNVSAIAEGDFRWQADSSPKLGSDRITKFGFPDLSCTRLVFVNGRYVPRPSHRRPLPFVHGVIATGLASALNSGEPQYEQLIKPHLGQYAEISDNAFTALNAGFIEDGAFIYIPKETKLTEPLHLMFVSTPVSAQAHVACHPRNLVVVEAGAEVTIIEDYISLGDDPHFSNSVTEIFADERSHVQHYLLERENTAACNISMLAMRQMADSRVESHSVLLGGQLVRNDIRPVLDGPNGDCLLNGLYIGGQDQHMDNHMRVVHAKPHCDSRQYYRGILDHNARAVFTGRIVVKPGAQKTDAKQTNQNLLLSDDAQADTRPQLEIYADDVKCTHGATVGQIDEDAVFYLETRGISEAMARAMLIYAFVGQSLDIMAVRPVRDAIRALVIERLPQGELLESLE